jgi:UDP-glucose 4-epimerase
MNILITGGAGYIGSHLVERLLKNKSYKLFILDNLSTGHKKLINKKTTFIKGDIKDIHILKIIFKKYNFKTVFHLAAKLNISDSQKNKKKYFVNNIAGTKNIIFACKISKVKNLILSSSCSIYGNINGKVNEKTTPNPQSYYAYTKYKSEELIKKYSKKIQYNYAILRFFNVAGASSSGRIGEIETSHGHLIKNIAVQSIKKNPTIFIYGNNYPTPDGTCIRDYIHISDLVEIIFKSFNFLNKYSSSLVINCGYGKGYSVLEIVKIFNEIKKNLKIKFIDKRPGDVAQVYSDTKKLNNLLKWRPKYNDIYKIIKSAINWEKKINKKL